MSRFFTASRVERTPSLDRKRGRAAARGEVPTTIRNTSPFRLDPEHSRLPRALSPLGAPPARGTWRERPPPPPPRRPPPSPARPARPERRRGPRDPAQRLRPAQYAAFSLALSQTQAEEHAAALGAGR